MGLAEKLAVAKVHGVCQTCEFYDGLSPADKKAFDAWLDAGHPRATLWRLCAEDGLKARRTAFGDHIVNHRKK